MIRVVHKYQIVESGSTSFRMPPGEVLHVAEQHGKLCLWALVDPTGPMGMREFAVVMTGIRFDYDPKLMWHLGTVLMEDGDYVAHVFEVIEKVRET